MAITPANFKVAIPITAVDLTGPAVNRASAKLGAVAARWGKVGIGAAGVALAATGVAAVRTGASFEEAFERAKFMTRATTEEVGVLEKTIQDVAFSTPFSPREIALGVKELGQAGLGVQQAIGAIRPVADFAIAAEMELSESSDTLLKSVKALGLPMENQVELMESMGHVSDVMTRAMVSSQTTIPLLGEAYDKVLPVLRSTRQEFVSSTAALSALADVGFKGEEGGTALRNILLRLGSPTKESQEAMRALGVETENVYDQFGRLRNLSQILEAFGKSGRFSQVLGRIAEIEKRGGDASYLENVATAMKEIGATGPEFQFIADIFEQRATAPFFALMEAQRSGKLQSLADIFNDPESAKALDLTERIMSTSQGAILRMQAAWSQMLINLGKTGFLDASARLFDVGSKFLVKLSGALVNSQPLRDLMNDLESWVKGLGDAVEGIGPQLDMALLNFATDARSIVGAVNDSLGWAKKGLGYVSTVKGWWQTGEDYVNVIPQVWMRVGHQLENWSERFSHWNGETFGSESGPLRVPHPSPWSGPWLPDREPLGEGSWFGDRLLQKVDVMIEELRASRPDVAQRWRAMQAAKYPFMAQRAQPAYMMYP